MHTDPIADFVTRVRNASRARLDRLDVPTSKIKVELAKVLKAEGFIEDFREIAGSPQGVIEVKLRYDSLRRPVISGMTRVSKPGLRTYKRSMHLPKIRNGLGIMPMTSSPSRVYLTPALPTFEPVAFPRGPPSLSPESLPGDRAVRGSGGEESPRMRTDDERRPHRAGSL